ncbi:MAG: short-chain dehydrogenase, partial [Zoogloea sp.]|nr:short-chain dehydrogenase [Zoogloea sp.]
TGQLADEMDPPQRQDNLYQPLPGDRGTHGRFDARATSSSWELWWTTHRWTVVAVALLLLLVPAGVLRGG